MILAPTLTLSAGSGAAIVRPTFSRDFAGEKTLNNGTGPAITFTRASNATYFDASGVLQAASNDAPRFDHDPATGASRGLLIEEARTNLLERSAEFDNAYWNKVSTTITANNTTSPDGTSSADLVEKAGNETTTPGRTLSVTAAAHTVSVFAKNSSGNRLRLRIDATGGTIVSAVFNTATGEVVSTDAGVTASVVNAGNGWYRCVATYTFASAVSASIGFSPRNEGADATGAKAWLWGAQLEAGAFPTSSIPTTTAAATRSADSAIVTPISSFYNQSEGTLFAEALSPNAAAVFVAQTFSDGTGSNELRQGSQSNGANPSFVVNDGGALQASVGISLSANTAYRICSTYSQNNFNSAANGTLGTPDTLGSIPSVSRLTIGARGTNTLHLSGHIRKIAYWPKRLTNTLLQQLTT